MSRARRSVVLTVAAVLALASLAQAQEQAFEGQRVAMHFADGQEPSYEGVPLFYHGPTSAQPVVYRTVWTLDARPDFAPVRVNANDFLYLWVNGEVALEVNNADRLPAEVDLAPFLKAGENVIAVSATKEGFALAGFAQVGDRAVPFRSRAEDWQNWKFAPLTILELEPFLTSASLDGVQHADTQQGSAANVQMTLAQGEQIAARALQRRLEGMLDELAYEAQLLAVRGAAIVDDTVILFGGAAAVPPAAVSAAERVREALPAARQRFEQVGQPASPRDEKLAAAAREIQSLRHTLDAAGRLIQQSNRAKYLALVGAPAAGAEQALAAASEGLDAGNAAAALERLEALASELASAEQAAEASLGAPLNDLDGAIANKAGWIDDPSLVDSVPGNWGVRVNPVETSWFMDLAGKWRFKLDPENTGLAERVHEFGYNIENQWPELDVPGTWEKQGAQFQVTNPNALEQSPYPGVNARTDGPYNGYAWYRKKVLVPAEWAGYDLELFIGAVDDYDWFYWNGEEMGHVGADTNPDNFWNVERHYRIPKEKVTFGGYNVIAVRVYDCGAGGGIMNAIQLRCPALRESFENRPTVARKPTRVYSGALSPVAMLTVGEKDLELFGWDFRGSAGPDGIVLNLNGQPTYRAFGAEGGTVYDAASDGELTANWMLLWNQPGRPDGDLPIQLVLLSRPRTIQVERAATGTRKVVIAFPEEGQTVLALRPVRADSQARSATDPSVLEACGSWSRAALALPMHYAEVARPTAGKDDQLDVTDVYDYQVFEDAWGTEPVKIAPLPPLASFGLKVNARGVELVDGVKPLGFSLGDYGQFHGVVGSDRISYRVPLDTLPRLGGFTAFCFSGSDVGTRGNIREVQLIAATGSNCWRPQSNDRGRAIMDTTRWTNEAGLSMVFNIDNGLGNRPEAIDHWVAIGEQCKDLPMWAVAYDLINEPANMPPEVYNPQIKRILEALRKVDPHHMVYIETPHSFASIDQFVNLEPVDDPAAVYTFHDYDYRLPPRWPKMDTDIRNIQHQWLPAFRFALEHDAPIAISEYGGFEQGGDPWNNRYALVLLNDFFKVFDAFGMHHQYYSNRGVNRIRADGSIRESYVQKGYRLSFEGDAFYRFREPWPATPRP